jgi:hypothetical protein
MTAVTVTAAAVLGAAQLRLLVLSWRVRSVLPLLCAIVGVALAGLALVSPPAGHRPGVALALALIVLVIGTVLYGIGQTLWSLLDDEPSVGDTDEESLGREARSNRTHEPEPTTRMVHDDNPQPAPRVS